GPVGAWVADVFYFLFGRPSFLFPVMLGLAGWVLYRSAKLPELNARMTLAFRTAGFLLTLITACGLAALHWDGSHLPSTAGGILGATVGYGLADGLSFLGATLLLLGLWL